MAIDTSKIKVRQGMKGKAVNLIHVYQDFLWALGDKSNPPDMDSIEKLDGADSDEESESEDLSEQMQSSYIADGSAVNTQQPAEAKIEQIEEERPALSTKGTSVCLECRGQYNS